MTHTIVLNLGIIEGYKKRVLENYIDGRFFIQRKSYDEYYVEIEDIELSWTINDLIELSNYFNISVSGVITLSDRD